MPIVKMSDSLKARLMGQVPGVEMGRDGEKTYAKYDRICFDPASGRVTFYWENNEQFIFDAGHIGPRDTLSITGIEGRMPLTLIG